MKKAKNTIVCAECGEIINIDEDSYVEIGEGQYVCQSCYDDYYFTCEDCGEIMRSDNAYYIEDQQKYVCENCINEYYLCEDCGNYFADAWYIQDYGYVCHRCYDRGDYGYCECCDRNFRGEDLSYSERHDCYYCYNCYEDDEDDLLYEYHAFNDWHLYKAPNEENVPYYIGKEIELEPKSYDDLESVLYTMNENLNAVGMHDGSLNEGGVEVVTHPESWLYLQSKKENYRKFFEEMEELQYGDDGNTGLHFHVSRPNDNVISRVIVLLESFKEEIKKLSRRNGDFHWSQFFSDYSNDEKENIKYKSTKYLKEKYIGAYHDRYVALNLNNTRTIEFRFFNGANNFEEFWGALQFIHNIMELALDEERDINTITWKELIYGDELIEQARKQEVLDIDKTAQDTTEIMERIETLKENTKKEIERIVKNFINYITKEMASKRFEIINKNNIDEIETKGHNFIDELSKDMRYLETITCLYRSINSQSIKETKRWANNLKENSNKSKDYSRYFKQIEKAINKYESEEI